MMFRCLPEILFSCLICLSAVHGGEGSGPAPVKPLLFFAESLTWQECRDALGKGAQKEWEKGVLFSRLESPPHAAMKRTALLTGRHAFFSSVYGEFPSRARFVCPRLSFDVMESGWRGWRPLWFSRETPLLIVGRDFAWWRERGTAARTEKRPVTPEDLGALLRLSAGAGSPDAPAGRDVRLPGDWGDLPSHVGGWEANASPERGRYRGGRVFCRDGVWEDTLFWKGVSADRLSPEQLAVFAEKSRRYADWWRAAVPRLKQPVPLSFCEGGEVRLGPNDWSPSVVEIGAPFMPGNGKAWKEEDILKLMASPPPGGLGGSWYVDVPREGNYELVFSLSPGEGDVCFQKGEALVRLGDGMATMSIMEGASQVRVPVDLKAGPQYLEINVTGQGAGRASSVSVPYAGLRYLGERVAPALSPRAR